MALGNPALDAAAGSPWQRGEPFGSMLNSMIASGHGRTSTTRLGRGSSYPTLGPRITGKAFGSLGPDGGTTGQHGPGMLPSAGALDYAHKLTSTTLLLGGLVAFLIFHRGNYKLAARRVASRHVGEV